MSDDVSIYGENDRDFHSPFDLSFDPAALETVKWLVLGHLFYLVGLAFAVLAVWKRGWDFTIRTVVSIGLVSGFSIVHAALLPLAEVDPIYATFAGNLLAGVGVLILFRHRASVGGMQIVALLLQDRWGLRAGWTLMGFDVLVIVAALLVVPWPNVLLSAAGAVLLNLVLALNHRPGRYLGR